MKGTPFYLHAWFQPVSEQQIITSTWFTAALSFLAVPVVLGLYYALRINNTNLILTTKFDQTSKQKIELSKQNARLKTEIDRRRTSEEELAYQPLTMRSQGSPTAKRVMKSFALQSTQLNESKRAY
ncbi:sensory box [Vibrio sp. JCM 19236]|nr:sensory box [Vibrio sp. JCM 19236]